jgi:hypothetical protein
MSRGSSTVKEESYMKIDHKQLLKYLALIFISVLLSYKLPYENYSIMQYLIKPIRFEDSVLTIAALFPLLLIIIGIKILFKANSFSTRNKIAIVIITFLLVTPLMKTSLDVAKAAYFGVNLELKTIDIKDANISFTDIKGNKAIINIGLNITDYGKDGNNFKVRMYLPESLSAFFNEDVIELGQSFETYGNRHTLNISEHVTVPLKEGTSTEEIFDSHWYWETFKYELYNESNSTVLTHHGI